jgi:hypothetical protein
VGNGPALNVVVVQKVKHGDAEWTEPTRVPALGRDEELPLPWLTNGGHVDVLGAVYADLVGADGRGKGRTFTTICEHNINTVKAGQRIAGDVITRSEPDWRRLRQLQREAAADGPQGTQKTGTAAPQETTA